MNVRNRIRVGGGTVIFIYECDEMNRFSSVECAWRLGQGQVKVKAKTTKYDLYCSRRVTVARVSLA